MKKRLALMILTLLACVGLAGLWLAQPELFAAQPAGGNPMLSLEQEEGSIQGLVTRTRSAGHYTYLEVCPEASKCLWLVTMGASPTTGSQAQATIFGFRRDFHSRRLSKTFDTLHFASVRALEGH